MPENTVSGDPRKSKWFQTHNYCSRNVKAANQWTISLTAM